LPLSAILVTGGSGFVGTHLLTELSNIGVERLVSLDIRTPSRPVAGVDYRYGDVRNTIHLDGQFDVVFNLAAVHRTPGHKEDEYFETNVAGAVNIIKFCETSDIRRLVFTSSIAVYGPSESPLDEDAPIAPDSSYGRSKYLAEEIHRAWLGREPGRSLVMVRPAVVFGLGEGGNFDRLLTAIRGRRFVYPGRRDTIKSCGYVGELVSSMLWALELERAETLYNFCYPEVTTIERIVETLAHSAKLPVPHLQLPSPLLISAARPFEVLERLGLRTGINPSRVEKLFKSTYTVPSFLVEHGYQFETDLSLGIGLWMDSLNAK
jgi:nucleoside-diphosphate-sugar epimerase